MISVNVIPLVAVRMLTFNHEKYIVQSIENCISQKTNFKYVLIIGEDCSTDNTATICKEYASKYPDRIQLICNEKNDILINSLNNFSACYASGAKYIALIEGDDYWTDPFKLQKQVDFLESNPAIMGCFHDAVVVNEHNNIIKENFYEATQKIYNQQDCVTLSGGCYATCSLVFRSLVLKKLPKWFQKAPSDYAIDLLITEFGNIAHISGNMGAYRIHSKGIWQGNKPIRNLEQTVFRYRMCLTYSKFRKLYGEYFTKNISELSLGIARAYRDENNTLKKLKYAGLYFLYLKPKNFSAFKFLILSLLFPSLYIKIKRLMQPIAKIGNG